LGTAAIVGAVIGQLLFGALADQIGRKWVFVITISLVIIGAIGSATAMAGGTVSIYTQVRMSHMCREWGLPERAAAASWDCSTATTPLSLLMTARVRSCRCGVSCSASASAANTPLL